MILPIPVILINFLQVFLSIFIFVFEKKKTIRRAASIEFTDLDFEDRQKIAVKLTLTRYWRLEARSSDARSLDRHFKISFGI